MSEQSATKNETQGNTKRNVEALTTVVKDDYVITHWKSGNRPTLPRPTGEQMIPVTGVPSAVAGQTAPEKISTRNLLRQRVHSWSFWDYIRPANHRRLPKED